MIQIKFKNLEKSQLAKDAVLERIEALVLKFEDLKESRIIVTLEMQNSPLQAGPDLFSVKLFISRGRFRGITVTKSDSNLYKALAEVVEHMLEVLNRAGDKERVKKRAVARQISRYLNLEKIGFEN